MTNIQNHQVKGTYINILYQYEHIMNC